MPTVTKKLGRPLGPNEDVTIAMLLQDGYTCYCGVCYQQFRRRRLCKCEGPLRELVTGNVIEEAGG